ncbi:hypothetical protein DFR52_105270 [Hoeflea marina]|uniref:Secreted protein n=1 Tax=Hoeflea marina TaxID=274592 RepID=A0A317PF05_9HYPH|nr:DUF1223 domain-containing protein [Hoeflea marina]PWV98288.1 hypothetical protein DFR52_105270 [Hoeflea marina]
MLKMIAVVALSLPALAAAPMPGMARDLVGVVELFTSQGCSSCPPADATLSRLIDEGKVLALSYHVDYWNYLGWKDTLSSPASTERQYGYARTLNRSSVYTPQAVINGRDHVNGADDAAIRAALAAMTARHQGPSVDVSIVTDPQGVRVHIGAGQGKANVVAVYFDEKTKVAIDRGENRGKTITYRHSVQATETIGMWSGGEVTLKLPESVLAAHPGRGCAILLQQVSRDGAPGAILGAAVIDAKAAG